MAPRATRSTRSSSSRGGSGKSRMDDFENVLTGMNRLNRDKRKHTTLARNDRLDEDTQAELYRSTGFGKRIVDLLNDDMVREWFTIEGDPDGIILEYMKRLKTKSYITRGLKWADIYGGSIVVMGINDGADIEEEVNKNNIQSIDFLRTFDRHQLKVNEYYKDEDDPRFGNPMIYDVYPSNVNIPQFRVHESRVLRFEGVDVPAKIRQENDDWADSIYQSLYKHIRDTSSSFNHASNILEEFVITILTMKNLAQLVSSGKDSVVMKRLQLLDLSKSILRTVAIDEGENLQKLSPSLGGIDVLLDKQVQGLSAVSGIPVTLLMGEAPAGLNATGDSDIRWYYDKIAARQENKLLPSLEKFIEIILLAQDNGFNGAVPDKWQIKFNALWQPTEKELAETRNVQAKTDEVYVNIGALHPNEVANSRFGGDSYSLDTQLDFERDTISSEDMDENQGIEDGTSDDNIPNNLSEGQ